MRASTHSTCSSPACLAGFQKNDTFPLCPLVISQEPCHRSPCDATPDDDDVRFLGQLLRRAMSNQEFIRLAVPEGISRHRRGQGRPFVPHRGRGSRRTACWWWAVPRKEGRWGYMLIVVSSRTETFGERQRAVVCGKTTCLEYKETSAPIWTPALRGTLGWCYRSNMVAIELRTRRSSTRAVCPSGTLGRSF